jgi:cytidylate kinase
MSFVVAIDGPAGTGKGTVTKIIAKDLGLINIDTGAMYRCVTLEALRRNVKPVETQELKEVLSSIDIKLKKNGEIQEVWLNGENVSTDIRTPEIDDNVAQFAALKSVRDTMTPLQRKMGENDSIIMEGRDIGTTVFPNANVKIYLDCSIEERANRRYKQNLEKGIDCTFEEVLESIKKRHKLETEREIAPLRQADDAILVDSTNLTIEEVVEKIENIIKSKTELK